MAGENHLKGKASTLRLTHGIDHQMDVGKNRYEVFTLVFNKFSEQIMSAQTAESTRLNFSWRVTEYQFLFFLVLCVQCRNNCLLRIRTNLKHDSEDPPEKVKTGTFSPSKHVTLREYRNKGELGPSVQVIPFLTWTTWLQTNQKFRTSGKYLPSKIQSTKIRKVNKHNRRKSNH